jgi:hypothetical protein
MLGFDQHNPRASPRFAHGYKSVSRDCMDAMQRQQNAAKKFVKIRASHRHYRHERIPDLRAES